MEKTAVPLVEPLVTVAQPTASDFMAKIEPTAVPKAEELQADAQEPAPAAVKMQPEPSSQETNSMSGQLEYCLSS